MLLTCDIGNTNIKTGIAFFNEITSLSVLIKKNKYRDIVVSSVVPSKTQKLTDNLSDLNLNPIIINKNSIFNLKIDYDSPETLGIDRICSAEGAYNLYCRDNILKKDQVIITIDLGTATTLILENI